MSSLIADPNEAIQNVKVFAPESEHFFGYLFLDANGDIISGMANSFAWYPNADGWTKKSGYHFRSMSYDIFSNIDRDLMKNVAAVIPVAYYWDVNLAGKIAKVIAEVVVAYKLKLNSVIAANEREWFDLRFPNHGETNNGVLTEYQLDKLVNGIPNLKRL